MYVHVHYIISIIYIPFILNLHIRINIIDCSVNYVQNVDQEVNLRMYISDHEIVTFACIHNLLIRIDLTPQ